MQRLDCAVIGAGPAGLEAAVNLKIRKKDFMLFGRRSLSDKISLAPVVENYLGLPGVTGRELASFIARHIDGMGIEITEKHISMVYGMGGYFSLASSDETFEAKTVILATGAFSSSHIKGEPEFLGRGVSYCATCDAPLYRGKTVAVLAYSSDAALEADFLAGVAGKVYYIPGGKNTAKPTHPAVEILGDKALEITGAGRVTGLKLEENALAVDGVFVLRDTVAPSSLTPGLELADGFIKVDAMMRTNITGLFAAGDCTGKPHQYMRAAGQGQVAALAAAEYIEQTMRKEN